jgi:hypothetical protein
VVLVSFLLVLAAAVTLVIGLLNSGLGLIYVSIGCSVAAGIVLALAVVRSRPERAAAPAAGSERLRALEEEETPTVTVVPTRGGRRKAAEAVDEEEDVEVAASGDGEGAFPIADYDELKVGEIVSLLPELDEDELEMVREREESGKNRSTILTRVEALSGAAASSGGSEWGTSDRWDSWSEGDEEAPEEEEDDGAGEEVGEEGIFPIADYDDLKAAEVVSLLPELDDDELDQVRDREERGAARATVLNRIDQLLGVEPAPARKAPAKKKAAAKRAPAKKAPAKKAAAKKSTAKKSTAKKSTAKKSTAKKSTAKKSTKKS